MEEILEKSEFAELVRYERERSERTNRPFSLITIDFTEANGKNNAKFFKEIIKIIEPLIRILDRVGWINKNTICVLLPETQIDGANVVLEKFKNKLKEHIGEGLLLLDFVVSTYPGIPDLDEKNIHSNETKILPCSPPAICTMEYSLPGLRSEAGHITLDPTCCLDLESIALPEGWQLVVKRLIDIIGAVFGIIIFSPVMLLIAAAIKLTSKGPLLFRQERMGYQGKKFLFLKFRSMYIGNDDNIHREYVKKLIQGNHKEINMGSEDNPCYKMKNDSRITPLGKILRKSSMDELPQFFNVLKGQMSLVGPRPPIPYELSNYQSWHLKRVLDVKPGITGLWQVEGRSLTTFDEMVRMDLHYAKNWSLWLDFKILFGTFKVVFTGMGAD
jgi:lipopolysaccharide/colanic/teichoic acid biosynthesis glycosyltransferase/GGDEF domain-containing protein